MVTVVVVTGATVVVEPGPVVVVVVMGLHAAINKSAATVKFDTVFSLILDCCLRKQMGSLFIAFLPLQKKQ